MLNEWEIYNLLQYLLIRRKINDLGFVFWSMTIRTGIVVATTCCAEMSGIRILVYLQKNNKNKNSVPVLAKFTQVLNKCLC